MNINKEEVKRLNSFVGKKLSVELKERETLHAVKLEKVLDNGIQVSSSVSEWSDYGVFLFDNIASISNNKKEIWPGDWSLFPKCPKTQSWFNDFRFKIAFLKAAGCDATAIAKIQKGCDWGHLFIAFAHLPAEFLGYLKAAKRGTPGLGYIILAEYGWINIEQCMVLIGDPTNKKWHNYVAIAREIHKKFPKEVFLEWVLTIEEVNP